MALGSDFWYNREMRPFSAIAARSAASFCLFSAALLGGLILVRLTAVPWLTRIEVEGKAQPIQDLLAQQAALTAELQSAEADRSELVLPVQDERYKTVRDRQQTQRPFRLLLEQIEDIADQARRDGDTVVMLQTVETDYQHGTLRLRGDVRNAGPGSMSVLAWFTDALRALPLAAEVPTPSFERMEDPYVGPYSPFDLTITLKQP